MTMTTTTIVRKGNWIEVKARGRKNWTVEIELEPVERHTMPFNLEHPEHGGYPCNPDLKGLS